MITTYQNYPSGFRVPVMSEFRMDTAGDRDVKRFMETMTVAVGPRVNSWNFRRNVLVVASKLFGDFRAFLEAQEKNLALSPHQRALLADTVTFINCGKRPISLRTRAELISAEKGVGYKTWPPSTPVTVNALRVPVEDYMYHWINHSEGFFDLLCTLDLIFGEPHEGGFHQIYL